MRVLVTGGAGFIGSHAAEELLRAGHGAVVLDDLSTGREENLVDVGVERVIGDVRDRAAVRRALAGVDGVLHLAGFVSVPGSIAEPVRSAEVNVIGTALLLEECRRGGVARLVFASSAAVYGDAAPAPAAEDAPAVPRSPYGIQKLAGEHLCRVASATGGPDTVSLRFFNVYGARQDPASEYAAVIPRFRERCERGELPRIHGDGAQTRDFVHVGDVAAGLRRVLEAAAPFAGETYNLARGEGTTIAELAARIASSFGLPAAAEHVPARAGDIRHSVAAIGKLRAAIGWTPPTGLADGLRILLGEGEGIGAGVAAGCTPGG